MAPFLIPVQFHIRRVDVQLQYLGRFLAGLDEQVQEEPLRRLGIHRRLAVLARAGRRVLKTLQGGLPCAGLAQVPLHEAVLAGGILLARQYALQHVAAKRVVVVQVLVAQGQPVDPLRQKLLDRVLDQGRVPMVPEAFRKLPDHPEALLHIPQQQPPGILVSRPPLKSQTI